jgi:hypothetical protein
VDMTKVDDLSILANVIAAARTELSDLDPEDIPNKLSGAASATGKRIPPPHQRAILAHIENDDGFREAVRERLAEAGPEDPLAFEYLDDPGSARPKIELAVAAGFIESLEAAVAAEKAKTAKVEAKLAESRTRVEGARKESAQQLSAKAEADKRSRTGLEKAARDADDRAGRATDEARVLEQELKERDEMIAALEARLVKLSEKRTKRRANRQARGDPSRAEVQSDPIDIAKDLDSRERGLRTFREAHLASESVARDQMPLVIPKGLSSADAAALDAVIAQVPERVIIDGYNVAGLVDPERFSTREARDDVINRAAKLVRKTDAAVVVVFDAQRSSEGTTTFTSPIGVEVVFEGDTIADDTIIEMVHARPDRCVVITNDREIHNRAQRSDCVTVFSSAFVSWTEHLNR